MQNLVSVICSRDVEGVFIKRKRFYQSTTVVIVFSIKLERICKPKGSRKSVMVEAKILYELCSMAAVTRHF